PRDIVNSVNDNESKREQTGIRSTIDPRSEPLRRFCVENKFARNRDPIAKKLAILIACSRSNDESKQRRRNSSRTTRYLESAANSLRPAADDNQGCALLLVVEARQQSVIEPVICPFALAVCKIACNIDPLKGVFASNSDPL